MKITYLVSGASLFASSSWNPAHSAIDSLRRQPHLWAWAGTILNGRLSGSVAPEADTATLHELEPLLPGQTYTMESQALLRPSPQLAAMDRAGELPPEERRSGGERRVGMSPHFAAPYGKLDTSNIASVKRSSDQAVAVTFTSARAASQFERELAASQQPSGEGK